jgi:hypothetical protein
MTLLPPSTLSLFAAGRVRLIPRSFGVSLPRGRNAVELVLEQIFIPLAQMVFSIA